MDLLLATRVARPHRGVACASICRSIAIEIHQSRLQQCGDQSTHVYCMCMCQKLQNSRAETLQSSNETGMFTAGYAGGDNILYDNYNAEMITKRSAQMYCQTGAPSFPVVEATIAGAHAVRTHIRNALVCTLDPHGPVRQQTCCDCRL